MADDSPIDILRTKRNLLLDEIDHPGSGLEQRAQTYETRAKEARRTIMEKRQEIAALDQAIEKLS